MTARVFHSSYDTLIPTMMPGDHFHCLGFASLLFGEGQSVFGLSGGGQSVATSALDFLYVPQPNPNPHWASSTAP